MNKELYPYGTAIKLGEHLLIKGDCSDQTLLDKYVPSNTITAVITDPPYSIAYTQSKVGFLNLANKTEIIGDEIRGENAYKDFTINWLKPLLPKLADKNSLYIFNCDKGVFALKQALDECDIHFGQLLIWVKSQPVLSRLDYLAQHEMIIYGWKRRHQFRKSKDKSVIFYPKPHKSAEHPTVKPLPIVRRLILNSTEIGETIFDGFLGSGTALLAAEQTKRKCIGFELEDVHVQTIINRFTKLTGIKPIICQP